MTDADHTITVTRTIDASAEDVYAAWTDPEKMSRWMAQTVDADVRVGGRYRNEVDAGDAGTFIHAGEYLELEPGRRIVQTFRAGPVDPGPDHKECLEITLRQLGPAQTELTFTDRWEGDGLDEEGQAATKAAWNGWLDQLAKLFRRKG